MKPLSTNSPQGKWEKEVSGQENMEFTLYRCWLFCQFGLNCQLSKYMSTIIISTSGNLLLLLLVPLSKALDPHLQLFGLRQHLLHQVVQRGSAALHGLPPPLFGHLQFSPQRVHFALDDVHLLNNPFLFMGGPRKLPIHIFRGLLNPPFQPFEFFGELPQSSPQDLFVISIMQHHLGLKGVQGFLNLSLEPEIYSF
jgi:hypothetical protein